MNRGTVICFGNFELPDQNAAAHRVVNNGKLLRALGFSTVFLGVDRGKDRFEGVKKRDYNTGFDMYELSYPQSAREWAKEIFDITPLEALVQAYPDTRAVMLYNTQYMTLLRAKKAFAPRGIAVLYDCTEWNGHTDGAALKRAVKALDSRLIERRLPQHADGIICVSTAMEKAYAGKTPLLRLPPLTDTQDPIWRQPAAQRERFSFCYAGAPSDKDRLDLLLAAFAQLPEDAVLRVIGVTQAEFTAAYPAAAAHAARENVLFTGRLSHEETVREILGCGCFVFLREPGRRNSAGFPTKFVEAVTCGVNVITTAVSDVPLYADEACLVLPDTSPSRLSDAMRSVTARPRLPRTLRDTFDYRQYVDETRLWLERIPCRED